MDKKLSQFKKAIVIPALLAAGLNCFAATSRNTSHIKSTSVGNKTVAYEKAAPKYTYQNAEKTLNDILNSDLNKMTSYDRLEAKVQNEVAGYLADQNANSLELAKLYKALEDHTVSYTMKKYNLTRDQINQIAAEGGVNDALYNKIAAQFNGHITKDEINLDVVCSAIQHYIQMILDTNSMIRFRADEAEIAILDEGDRHNEYRDVIVNHLRLNNKGKRGLREEATAVLNAAEAEIVEYTKYENTVNGKDGNKMAKHITDNLNKIKSLVTKSNLTQKDRDSLKTLVRDTAVSMSEKMYGTLDMRYGLVLELASVYAMNNTLTVMANLGYDIDNIQPGVFVEQGKQQTTQTRNATINPEFNTHFTNEHAGIGLGLTGTNPLGKNWDITYGGEFNADKGYDTVDDSLQFLSKVEAGKTFNNDNRLSFGAKAGLQVDAKGLSTPFGVQAGYNWNINNNLSLDFGINSLLNIQRSLADIGASVGATYRGKNWTIGFHLGLAYTATWNKDRQVDPLPDLPPIVGDPISDDQTQEPPIYGEDEVIKPNPDETVNRGDDNLPEKDPGDLSWYKR